RDSIKIVSSTPTMPMAPKPKMVAEVHSYSLPPHVVIRMSELMEIAMVAKPIQSKHLKPCSPTRSFNTKIQTTMARRPSGILTNKPKRQPGPAVNQPPRTGPKTDESPNTPHMIPMNLPRSRAETTSDTMDWEEIIIMPAPKPWMARPAIKMPMPLAKPPTVEPITKIAIPAM